MGTKFEYRVMQARRTYTWEVPFFYVERRAPGGTWTAIPGLTHEERQSISNTARYGNDKEKAIVRAKQIERLKNRFDHHPRIRYTLAYRTFERPNDGTYLCVQNSFGWWKSNDDISIKLDQYKGIKKFFHNKPFYAQSTTATLDGEYKPEHIEQNGLTADLSRPFLLGKWWDK